MWKHAKQSNHVKLLKAWHYWRKCRRLSKAKRLVYRSTKRKVIDLWVHKIANRKLMKKVANEMVRGHHMRCFTSAFNEWRNDSLTERMLEAKLKRVKRNKLLESVQILGGLYKSGRKRRNSYEKAVQSHKWNVFHRTVHTHLCGKIDARRSRHAKFREMHDFHARYMLRSALQNMLVFQKLQRALRFNQVKVYDEFMFNLKRVVNITRYHKALMAVGVSMLRRKTFHAFRWAIARAKRHRKYNEQDARARRKPTQGVYFSTAENLADGIERCDSSHRLYRLTNACVVLFRYQRWQVLKRRELISCDKHLHSYRLRAAVHKLLRHRNSLHESRKIQRFVQRARVFNSLEHAMHKFHSFNLFTWSHQQRVRRSVHSFIHVKLARALRALQQGARDREKMAHLHSRGHLSIKHGESPISKLIRV